MELLNAKWDLDSGRTVELRLVEQPGEDRVNPFKKFQKRRGGHVGQIFRAAVVTSDTQVVTYDADFMLAGWGESSSKGQWVSFWLDEESSHHPFAGFRRRVGTELGRFFMAVLVALDEEGKAVDLTAEQRVINATSNGRSHRRLSQDAHLIVTGNLFIQWLREKTNATEKLEAQGKDWTPTLAKQWAREKLGVESFTEIDINEEKAQLFHKIIRRPFADWAGDHYRE